ncbi:MAG: hypothetical protein HN368_18915 [Spirochaetales bacterium]|jgi:hypothetical protein|nr:hypothetical protein [Spirochaetales bacterium]
MKPVTPDVPRILRLFFIFHFALDILFAIPMFIAPVRFLGFLGWINIDPVASRLVAAALFGIGIESLIGCRASADSFLSLLNLKIIWSVAAVAGILISIAEMGWAPPFALWLFLAIFTGFNALWIFWRFRLM